jgi:hypothetical protein
LTKPGLCLNQVIWCLQGALAAVPRSLLGQFATSIPAKQQQQHGDISLGSWQAAAPAAAGGGRGAPLLEYAAAQLAPVTAEGIWASLGTSVDCSGLPCRHTSPCISKRPGGAELLQAAQLLLSAGHTECGLHILREWVLALSLPAMWHTCQTPSLEQLVQLWHQHMQPAEQHAWFTERQYHMRHKQPKGEHLQCMYALCTLEFVRLIGKLLGPVAGEHRPGQLPGQPFV